jgi:hypothetical protein
MKSQRWNSISDPPTQWFKIFRLPLKNLVRSVGAEWWAMGLLVCRIFYCFRDILTTVLTPQALVTKPQNMKCSGKFILLVAFDRLAGASGDHDKA